MLALHYICTSQDCIFDCYQSFLFFARLLLALTALYLTNYYFTLYYCIIAVQVMGALCVLLGVHDFIRMLLAN
jgi:hypothetical protein